MPLRHEEREPLIDDQTRQDYGPFGFTPEQLGELVDPKDPGLLKKYGGVKKILEGLKVDPTVGLKSDEGLESVNTKKDQRPFKERQEFFGKNVLPDTAQRSLISLIWEAYQDKTLILLSIAAFVSLAVGINEDYSPRHPKNEPRVGWVEGVAILSAVAAVVFTNAINDYQKEKQFRKLNSKKEDRTVKLIRDGKERQISVYEINVGDILLLEPGDIVPVDGIYLDGHNLTCDESSATGESDSIKKGLLEDGMDPFILSGGKVLEGVGKAVVIAVGPHSFFGKTMVALRGNGSDETPLQQKLDHLAEHIAKFGISVALIMLITLVIKFFISASLSDDFPDGETIFASMVSIVIQAITIVVVAVPEGLPMAVTLSLAYATTQMIKDNNLVRVLSACETMGNATAVCSDKTGTLTQNRMTVVEGVLGQKLFNNINELDSWKEGINSDVYEIIIENITINSSAFEDKGEKGNLEFIGSKTECALLGFSKKFGVDYHTYRHENKSIKVYPFASQRKTMTTIIKLNSPPTSLHGKAVTSNVKYRVLVKGASEIILSSCTHFVDVQGQVQEFNNDSKSKFQQTIDDFANKALRTIGLAYRDITDKYFQTVKDEEPPLENLICLGIVGIQDPLRPGVVDSVNAFRKAGVSVRMITGDNILTASAIARNAGILTKGIALTGPEFRKMSKEEQLEKVPRLQVLARSSPTDKTVVVTRLKELGEVIAVTGDGTNDGPALKLADVGFSMGIAGTEVAKEASSIVLMDDNFNSIVKALKWGRAVNDSVRKFLQFQLTVNIAAVLLSFISSVASDDNESILTAVQLLWINLIMDTLAALALATEPPTDELLNRRPTDKTASLINYRMWKMIIGQAIFQVAINLFVIHMGSAIFHLDEDSKHDRVVLRTIVFNTFVFLQVFNEINCRRIDDSLNVFKNIFHNYIFIIVQIVVIIVQLFIVEFGGVAFGTTRLTWYQWLVTVLIGSLSLPIGLIIRLMPDACVPESVLNEDFKPRVSESKMQWETAVDAVQLQLKVFSMLRKTPRKSSPKFDVKSKSGKGNKGFANIANQVKNQPNLSKINGSSGESSSSHNN